MEEKENIEENIKEKENKSKSGRKFFGRGAKTAVSICFILMTAIFTISTILFYGLTSGSGFTGEDLQNKASIYEETENCGNLVVTSVANLMNGAFGDSVFSQKELTDEDTIDITDPFADEEDQNEYTTYTVANLKKIVANENDESIDALLAYLDDGSYYDDYDVESMEQTAGSLDVEIEDEDADWGDTEDYSAAFRYLYVEGLYDENYLPESGIPLAEYARENSETVSLRELYQKLVEICDELETYEYYESYRDTASNILYRIENTETGEVYTNDTTWKPAVNDGDAYPFFYSAERTNGKLSLMVDENAAYEVLQESFAGRGITGNDETIFIAIDAGYPVHDELYQRMMSYPTFLRWSNVLLVLMVLSFLLGCACFVLGTVQAGRVSEDREVHTAGGRDSVPVEIWIALLIFLLGGMLGIGAVGLTGIRLSSGYALYQLIACGFGQMACAALALLGWNSIARQWKEGSLWKHSLLCSIVHLCKTVYRARTISGRLILRFTALMLGNLLLLSWFGFLGFLVDLVIDILVLLYLIREQAGQQVIYDGLERIAGGELDYKIDPETLTGESKIMAAKVNSVGDGLQAAVDEKLKSERLKADLITNVSHDIKTPLTSIINYVDLLKRENIQDPKIRGYVDVLDKKSQRLKQLTEDLVEASKVSSGNVNLDMQSIQLGELVRQINGEFEEKFRARELQLICRMEEGDLAIRADGMRLWRVLENLYNNTVKYAMTHTRVYVNVYRNGQAVVFEIKNISEQPLNFNADELTERFVRGDVSRSTEGSGLGLSIAKNLVTLQGGDFHIDLDGDLFKVTILFEADGNPENAENSVG